MPQHNWRHLPKVGDCVIRVEPTALLELYKPYRITKIFDAYMHNDGNWDAYVVVNGMNEFYSLVYFKPDTTQWKPVGKVLP